MRRDSKAIGAYGESHTILYLESQGYRVIDANVRPEGGLARGELDLVAWHAEYLVFVEIKTRRRAHGAQGTPAESITRQKRKQLFHLANLYLAKHELTEVPCRFDVVEVVLLPNRPAQFRLLADAFDATDLSD